MKHNYWLAAGMILNALVILVNRFVMELLDALNICLLITGIILLIIGLIKSRRSANQGN